MTLYCSKKIAALLRGTTSNCNGDYYCLNCLHLFRTKTMNHVKVCENKDFSKVAMPSEDSEILEFNHYCKFDKAYFTIYADYESWIERIDVCKNNPKKPCTTKITELILSGFSVSTTSSFKDTEVKIALKLFMNPEESMQ